ncbi:hypothetical protein DRA43_02510 [Micromonospora provocatoris]|nr:hypothetical protein DRA43_02510 [Micromonospora provocatoris]
MYGRVLLFAKPQYVKEVPSFLDPFRSGFGLCGPKAGEVLGKLRRGGYDGLLLADPSAYDGKKTGKAATEEEPFDLPLDRLFGGDLTTVLQDQFDRGATVGVAPSRFIHAGHTGALKALVMGAQSIERDDVIVPVPIDVAWLRDEFVGKLIAWLRRIPHAKGLALGSQGNPTERFAAATKNLRTVVGEVPDLGLWRGDVQTAFDCMVHGAAFAVIGTGGSLRHVIPPDEEAESRRPYNHTPSVFIRDMLRYSMGEYIAQRYADSRAPRCFCQACGGRGLEYFNSRRTEVRVAAQHHNALAWTQMLDDLFGHATVAERQRWWKGCCASAVNYQEAESVRLRQPGAFTPSLPLRKMAVLPLASEVPAGGR